MHRTLLHIYGPLYIHSFGLMIALGLILFTWLILRDPKRKHIIGQDQFIDTLLLGIVIALASGRLLYVICEPAYMTSWLDIISIWDGGLSLLGAIIGVISIMPLYLYYHGIAPLALLDLVAIYTPLLQAISRVGCFFAGCCYGAPTNVIWSVIYNDFDSIAPLGICLHPSQLYSTLMLSIIFIIMYCYVQKIVTKSGQLLGIYLMLAGFERFTVDFLRGDRDFYTLSYPCVTLSVHQWIALAIVGVGCILFMVVSYIDCPEKKCA
jgi:phosphatidylglycerol:prolipoprotein diacylglycerol transferase